MNDLLKINERKGIMTVNARTLWRELESKQDFSTWIKNRIEKYGFVEGLDYLLHKFMEQLPSGAKHVIDYHLSIDMAKELAMVENNETGRKIRQYFIRVEKDYRKKKEIRDKSKQTRNLFTGVLKNHGCTEPRHYMLITVDMKDGLHIDRKKKKEHYTTHELLRTMASEAVAAINMDELQADGFQECHSISVNACRQIANATRNRMQGRP